jgi:hypothetical protein
VSHGGHHGRDGKEDGIGGHHHQQRPACVVGSSSSSASITPEQIYSTLLGSMSVASSTETLLRNIEGLLRVAADSARQQERQVHLERGQFAPAITRVNVYNSRRPIHGGC